MTTKFTEKFRSKTDSELSEYLNNKSSYQKEAVLTALLELQERGNSNKQIEILKDEMQSKLEWESKNEARAKESKIPTDLPSSISNAAKIIYLSAALGIVNPIMVELTTEVDNLSNPINLIIILSSTSILAFFGYQINLGKRWARDIFTVLVGLGILIFPLVIMDFLLHGSIVWILSLTQGVLQGYSIYLLFKLRSKKWYQNQT